MTMIEYLCLVLYVLGAFQTKVTIDLLFESRGCDYNILTIVLSCLMWPLVMLFSFCIRAVGK